MVRRFALLSCVVASVTSNSARADRVALEGYVGDRPSDASRVMATFRPLLERNRFIVDPTVLEKAFADHAWRSGGSKSVAPRVSSAIDSGINTFLNADWEGAVKALREAIDLGLANPIAWVNEPKYRTQMQRGLLYLALACSKQSDDEAAKKNRTKSGELATERDTMMAEMIRIFPSSVVTRKQYGLEAEQLFQRVRDGQDLLGRGTLELNVDDPNAVVYVDDAVRPTHTTLGDLIPGKHHVLVALRSGDTHDYTVEVIARQTARLTVASDLDSMLVLANDWVGFKYPSQVERSNHEPQFVADLVGKNTNATLAVVFTVGRANKHSTIAGTVYGTSTAKTVRTCQVTLADASDTASMEQVLACLTGGASQGLVSGKSPTTEPETKPVATKPPEPRPAEPKPTAEARDQARSDDVFATADPGHTGHVPAASVNEEDTSEDTRPSYVLPASLIGIGAVALGIGVYLELTAEPPPTPPEPKYVYSGAGIALGVGGIAVGAVGGYLWYRVARSRSSAPNVQASTHEITIGWAGHF